MRTHRGAAGRRQRGEARGLNSAMALGWVPGPGGGVVVAAFPRERLGEGLAALHGRGFGSNARVLDGARGDLTAQLRRAGLPDDIYPAPPGADTALLLVHVPGREVPVGDLLLGAGATDVRVVNRPGPRPDETAEVTPDAAPDLGGAALPPA